MEQVINVVMNGQIFHFANNAYLKLDAMLRSQSDREQKEAVLATYFTVHYPDQQVITESMTDEALNACDIRNEPHQDTQCRRQLKRLTKNKLIGGVCAGLAEYFQIDVALIRVLFVLLTCFVGGGILCYLLLWIFLPAD